MVNVKTNSFFTKVFAIFLQISVVGKVKMIDTPFIMARKFVEVFYTRRMLRIFSRTLPLIIIFVYRSVLHLWMVRVLNIFGSF